MSEIRYDLIHDEYALIAPERLRRPDCLKTEVGRKKKVLFDCPFCPGNEAMTPPEIFALRENEPNKKGWKTRVVPNLYKAVQIETPWQAKDAGIFQNWEGFGAHEVIIDTPRHLLRMDEWSKEEYFNWLYTMRERINDLKHDLRLTYMSLFKNHGRYAGSTQPHPHTQLIALPVVPKRVLEKMKRAYDHYHRHGRSLFEDVMTKELNMNERIVVCSEYFLAVCPYASGFAFEVMIFSRKGSSSIDKLGDEMLHDLANVLKQTINALYVQLGDMDFNITIESPPMQKNYATESFFDDTDKIWRFYMRIVPRLFRLGGFEICSDIMINPVAPEEATELLRQCIT